MIVNDIAHYGWKEMNCIQLENDKIELIVGTQVMVSLEKNIVREQKASLSG